MENIVHEEKQSQWSKNNGCLHLLGDFPRGLTPLRAFWRCHSQMISISFDQELCQIYPISPYIFTSERKVHDEDSDNLKLCEDLTIFLWTSSLPLKQCCPKISEQTLRVVWWTEGITGGEKMSLCLFIVQMTAEMEVLINYCTHIVHALST